MKAKFKAIVPIIFLFGLLLAFQAEAARLNKPSAILIKGQSVKLKVIGTSETVKWSSDKKSVAAVTKKGKVTAKKKGTAIITAKLENQSLRCLIVVQTPSISNKKATLPVGRSLALHMNGASGKIKWKSSKPSVASVNKNGLVTAKKVGAATITATVMKKKYTCKVKVTKAAIAFIKTAPVSVSVKIGETVQVIATATDVNQKDVTTGFSWKSEDSSIAKVNSKGRVTGVSIGTTNVVCSIRGKKRPVRVQVSKDFDEIQAANAISYTSHVVKGGIVVIAKNNYKYGVNLTMTCLYRSASGAMLGIEKDTNHWLEPGRECALFAMDRLNKYLEKSSSYEISFSAADSQSMISNANDVSLVSNIGQNGIMVQARNDGVAVSYTSIAAVFTLNGKPVGYGEKTTEDCANSGSSAVIEIQRPLDGNYEAIPFDGYKLYVNNSYGYTWKS